MLTPTLPESYIGHLLYLEPVEMIDWASSDGAKSPANEVSAQDVSGFHLRVKYFLTLSGTDAWCGLVGTVEQETHPFDQFWIGCSVNYSGYPDFTDHLRISWCRVGPYRPQEAERLRPSGFPTFTGRGIIAEDINAVTEALEAKQLFGSFYS